MIEVTTYYPENKLDRYELLIQQINAVFHMERDLISNLSNLSAILNEAMPSVNWVGFYLMKNGQLILGPFQGKLACVHIAVGKGVCGTAVQKKETQLVPDVHQFPGHIACDSATNSEIVIPMIYGDTVYGVLDIDSPVTNNFDEIDAKYLEQIVEILIASCDWNSVKEYDF